MTALLNHLFEAQQQYAEAQAKAEQERQAAVAQQKAEESAQIRANTKLALKLCGIKADELHSDTEFIVDGICFKVMNVGYNNPPFVRFEIEVSNADANPGMLAYIAGFRHTRWPNGKLPNYLPEYKNQPVASVKVTSHHGTGQSATPWVSQNDDLVFIKARLAEAITTVRESYRIALDGLPDYEAELAKAKQEWESKKAAEAEAQAKAEAEEQAERVKKQAAWEAEQERLANERQEREKQEAADFQAKVELAKEALAPFGLSYEQFKDVVKALVAEAINESRCYEY